MTEYLAVLDDFRTNERRPAIFSVSGDSTARENRQAHAFARNVFHRRTGRDDFAAGIITGKNFVIHVTPTDNLEPDYVARWRNAAAQCWED